MKTQLFGKEKIPRGRYIWRLQIYDEFKLFKLLPRQSRQIGGKIVRGLKRILNASLIPRGLYRGWGFKGTFFSLSLIILPLFFIFLSRSR